MRQLSSLRYQRSRIVSLQMQTCETVVYDMAFSVTLSRRIAFRLSSLKPISFIATISHEQLPNLRQLQAFPHLTAHHIDARHHPQRLSSVKESIGFGPGQRTSSKVLTSTNVRARHQWYIQSSVVPRSVTGSVI